MASIEDLEKKVNQLQNEVRFCFDKLQAVDDKGTVLQSFVDELQSHVVPVGAIVSSLFAWETLKHLLPKAEHCWLPADGRPLPDCRYRQESGKTTAPDLRAMFLRGVNKFGDDRGPRTDSRKDPDTRKAGDEQPQAIAAHGHALWMKQPAGFQKGANGDWASNIFTEGNYNRRVDDTVVASDPNQTDTRPNNVSVFWYLKIN